MRFCRDLYGNQFLFWAVSIGMVSVFVTVNVSVVNTKFFKHTAITWEWGLVIGFTMLFIAGMETWKAIKRAYNIMDERTVVQGVFSQGAVEGRSLPRALSFSSLKGWASFGKRNTGDNSLYGGTRLVEKMTSKV